MNPIIEVKNISKKFRNSVDAKNGVFTALEGVSFSLSSNSITIIGGANGSGKSVLMSIIAGLVTPTRGSIKKEGRVGLIFQDADTQILGETPEEDIAFGLKNIKKTKNEQSIIIDEMMKKTGIEHRKGFPARFLSGGEKRRLAVASILALDCSIIIFDEPYANLDYEGVRQVNNLIKMLKGEGKTIIILTHELEKCLGLAERFIVLYKGNLVFNGTAQEGLQAPLESWKIKNPLSTYKTPKDLVW